MATQTRLPVLWTRVWRHVRTNVLYERVHDGVDGRTAKPVVVYASLDWAIHRESQVALPPGTVWTRSPESFAAHFVPLRPSDPEAPK